MELLLLGNLLDHRHHDSSELVLQLLRQRLQFLLRVFLRPLDRGMEYEADRLGVLLATRAGYDPFGLVAVLQMLAQAKGDGSGTSIFDTHPAAGDRIGELEKVMPGLERYASNPQLEPRFRQVVGK